MKKTKIHQYFLLCMVAIGSLSLSGCEVTSIHAEEYKTPIEMVETISTIGVFSQSVVQLATSPLPYEYTQETMAETTYIAAIQATDSIMEEWEKTANEMLKIQYVQDIGEHIAETTQYGNAQYEVEYPLLQNEGIDFYVGQFIAERKQSFNHTYDIVIEEIVEYNHIEAFEESLNENGEIVSGVVVESVESVEIIYSFYMTYDIYSLPNNVVSVIFYETEKNNESNQVIERIHSFLFDELLGAVIEKEEYLAQEIEFGISKYFEERLLAYVIEYFEDASEYDGLAYGEYSDIFTEGYPLHHHFGKTNTGILISFNSGTLFPSDVGAVTIPISEELMVQLKSEATTTKEEATVHFIEKENGEIQLPFLRREGQIDSSKPMVALTIDDGPSPVYTPRILNVLEQYDAVATFYDVGSLVDRYPDIVKQQYDQGSELGYHSYNHDNFKNFTATQIRADMEKNKAAYMKAVGGLPTTFRPPYGSWDKEVLDTVDVALINWSVDTLDWKSRNVNSIMNIIYSEGSLDGKVILMHGIYESSVQAIEILVPYLVEQGYQLVTVSELINERYGVVPQAGEFYGYNEFS